jgi:hypothetical protein
VSVLFFIRAGSNWPLAVGLNTKIVIIIIIIIIIDISVSIHNSNYLLFADELELYRSIKNVEGCKLLQLFITGICIMAWN